MPGTEIGDVPCSSGYFLISSACVQQMATKRQYLGNREGRGWEGVGGGWIANNFGVKALFHDCLKFFP